MATPENQKIAVNLATAEKERVYEPFVVALPGGETVTFNDPRDLEWQDLAALEDPIQFVRLCLSEEDKAKLRKERLAGWQFNKIMTEFNIHFGIGTSGNAGGPRF